jgi:hypothetical protein
VRFIQAQHEALGMGTGIVGALAWCRRLPAGGKIRNGDLAHHVAQPLCSFHSRSGGRFLHLLVELGWDVEREVAHSAHMATTSWLFVTFGEK